MKIINIIIRYGEADSFDMDFPANENKLIINSHATGENALVRTKIFETLRTANFQPSSQINDLLNLAIGVYTSDQIVSRRMYGFQGWSRHFKLYVPVVLLSQWESVKSELEQLLSFLSGDKWEIFYRSYVLIEDEPSSNRENTNTQNITKVALFSGGMDSFISAIDLLEDKNKVAFISHYKSGGSEGSTQHKLYDDLSKIYGKDSFLDFQIYVQPNQKHPNSSKEDTSRARSFLFLCLGLSIANCFGDNIEFIVPENGLISLNVPLTGTRLSSHSTRTTHPFYISSFIKIVNAIGIHNPIRNPYQFFTKGEMMESCKNKKILADLNKDSLSCSHPERSRFKKGQKPGIHCGYCVPCIIRQASEYKSGIKGTEYDILIKTNPPNNRTKSGRDLRAFKLAVERLNGKNRFSVMFDVLSAGPLPFQEKAQLDNYIDTYLRGMKEVKDFLESK